VETAFLSVVSEQARARGCQTLRGAHRPTKKNAPCKDFYESHGFSRVGDEGDASIWEFDLSQGRTIRPPDWIRVLVQAPA
jgi:predicted enzyme involved in methoxymalonyl-ACP biosynthesis